MGVTRGPVNGPRAASGIIDGRDTVCPPSMRHFVQRYRFRSTWRIAAPVQDVYSALSVPVDYPRWWPQVREVRMVDPEHHWMVVRSFLPYDLTYMLTAEIADPANGILQGHVDGDIIGRVRWQIDPGSSGCEVRFEERVRVQVDLLNVLTPIARIWFDANHRLMMRDGLIGLRGYIGAGSLPADAHDSQRWMRRV